MWVKGWLVVFGTLILVFYAYYLIQIFRGQPERFEEMMLDELENIASTEPVSVNLIVFLISLALLLEGGYFVLTLIGINILPYRILTGLFIAFEIWHGLKLIPVLRVLAGKAEFSSDLMDWRIERLSARFFTIHILITLGLVFAL
jgi:hypothetical protein